jgi:tetratricopeptide (TPR) repeat protein
MTQGCNLVRLFVTGLISLHLGIAGAPLSAEQQPKDSQSSAQSSFVSAQKLLAAGDSAAGREKLILAIQKNPNYAEAYLLLGLIEFQQGDTASSIGHYRKGLELQPGSYSGHYNLALAYLKEHKLKDGRAQLEQAVKLDPMRPDAAYDLGLVLLELGRPDAAVTHLLRAKALKPGPDVTFNLVRAELEAGQIAQARTEAQGSAKLAEQDFRWNGAIGQLFLKNGQAKEAAVYLGQAKRINPDDAEIHHQLAVAYLESHQSEELFRIIADPKTPDDYFLRASAYYSINRFPEADQESNQALALAPDNPQILVLRTRLLQRAGEQDNALQVAKKAVALAPNWDEPYYLAGVSSYFIRRYEEASQDLARARELNPKSARAFFLESIALANLGKLPEAEQGLRRAIALQPKNARFHCHLGILLARVNKYPEAETSFRKAIQLKPEYALSHYELGKLLVNSKLWKQAAGELEAAVTHDPTLSAAYYQLSRAYRQLGETKKSEDVLAKFQKLYDQQNDQPTNDSQTLDNDAKKETQ